MKVAVVGTGKTGSHLLNLIPKHDLVGVFNSQNPVSVAALQEADVIIAFVAGPVFLELIPTLLESKRPVVTGATGFEWPASIEADVKKAGVSWLYASNFSMGIQLLRPLLQKIASLAPEMLEEASLSFSESHHTHKKDAPSGTALTLREWLGDESIEITSIREGDIVGIHTLLLETPYEKIELTHTAKDRKLFAAGALWAAKQLLTRKIDVNLYSLNTFLEQTRLG